MQVSPMTGENTIEQGFWLEEWLIQPWLGRMVRRQVGVHLRPRVLDVLLVLADRPGEVVSDRELVDRVWSSGFVSENTITHCVKELREDLGDTASSPRFVETIPRRGYRLIGHVRPIQSIDAVDPFGEARGLLVADRWWAFLVDGGNVIGRGDDVPICVDSEWISRHHARITVGDGGAVIEDLGSKNGTYVGDQRIDTPTPLADGDLVKIGDVQFEFRSRQSDQHEATWTLDSEPPPGPSRRRKRS